MTLIERPTSKQPIPEGAICVYKGPLFEVFQWKQTLFNGTKQIFEKVRRPDTVVIFPVLDNGNILLCKQEQPGCQSFVSAIGGRIEPSEDPLTAAHRELIEETGHTASELILWDAQQPIAKIDWAIYTFIAKGLRRKQNQNLDAGERIDLFSIDLDSLIDLSVSNSFRENHIAKKLLVSKVYPEELEPLRELFAV